jgi:hypothetical protein
MRHSRLIASPRRQSDPPLPARAPRWERLADYVEIPALLAPLLLLVLPALICWLLWEHLPSMRVVVATAAAAVAVALFVAQWAAHAVDPLELTPSRLVVQLTLLAWYAGISLGLIRRLVHTR